LFAFIPLDGIQFERDTLRRDFFVGDRNTFQLRPDEATDLPPQAARRARDFQTVATPVQEHASEASSSTGRRLGVRRREDSGRVDWWAELD
jgi:hypothetical protein